MPKTISSGDFQWLGSGPESKQRPQEWYSSETGVQKYSSSNPYVKNGQELSYEQEKNFRNSAKIPPVVVQQHQFQQPTPTHTLNHQRQFQQPPPPQLLRVNKPQLQMIPQRPQHVINPAPQIMMNQAPTIALRRVNSQPHQIIPNQHPQLQRRNTLPFQAHQPSPATVRYAPQPPMMLASRRLYPIPTNAMRVNQPLLLQNQHQHSTQNVLQSRILNSSIQQSFVTHHIQNNKQPVQLATAQLPTFTHPQNKPTRPYSSHRQNRSSRRHRDLSNPGTYLRTQTNYMQPHRNMRSVMKGGPLPPKSIPSTTQNLLEFNRSPLPQAPPVPQAPPAILPTPTKAPPHHRKDDNNVSEVFTNLRLATKISKYLNFKDFVQVFGCLNHTCHEIMRQVPYVHDVTFSLTDSSMVQFNQSLWVPLSHAKTLRSILNVLSPQKLHSVKFDVDHGRYDIEVLMNEFINYLSKAEFIRVLTIEGPSSCSPMSQLVEASFKHLLNTIPFNHLVVENNPFSVFDVSQLTTMRQLTLSSDIDANLELIESLPQLLESLTLSKPEFTMQHMIDILPGTISQVYIRNPMKKKPLDPRDMLALFRYISYVELDFSLIGSLPDVSQAGPLKLRGLRFWYDGSSDRLTKQELGKLPKIPMDLRYLGGNHWEYKRLEQILAERNMSLSLAVRTL